MTGSELAGARVAYPYARPQRGFSLAELAITLVVIGLLAGLTMLGQGVLAQSRIKALVNNFEGLKIATLTYPDRYSAPPGGDGGAATRWAGAKSGTGDARLGGSYQAAPPAGDPTNTLTIDPASKPVPGDGETLNFWWHLRLSQVVLAPPPIYSLVAQPLNYYGGDLGAEWAPLGFPRLAICTANLPGDIAIGLENQLDDGNPRTGLIRAAKQHEDNEAIATADASLKAFAAGDADIYILCRRLD